MLVDALIYLAATVICVPIAQRLKLGAVLGYLIAGALIGPWGLKLVEDIESIIASDVRRIRPISFRCPTRSCTCP